MSAQDTAGIARDSRDYSNTAESASDSPRRLASELTAVAAGPALWVALFTVLGLAVRLYRLEARGLWFDEVTFAYSMRLDTPAEVLRLNGLFGDQTPLSFFLTWLVRGLGGSEWAVRLPFAIAGTLTVPAIYFLARDLARPRVGLVAALLFALSPFAVFYSQDAHPYAPLLLFTTLQMLFAYRAAMFGRWSDWAGLALSSVLNLYNDYIGLITSAVVALFLTLALLSRATGLIGRRGEGPSQGATAPVTPRKVGAQLALAAITLAAILLAYLPWLPSLRNFFSIPNSGFDRLPKGAHGTFADVQTLAHGFGIGKFLAALLFLGVAYTVVTLVRERRLSSLLLLIWIVVPLAGYWLRAGDAMFLLKAPYYSFLLPAAVVLIAIGLEAVVKVITVAFSYSARRTTPSVRAGEVRASRILGAAWHTLYAALVVLALMQTTAALATSYSAPKAVPQDYRGVVDRVIADSTPDSMVLSLGMWGIKPSPEYLVDGVNYYLWLRRSPIKELDGTLLDQYTATHFPGNDSTIWGVYALPWSMPAGQLQRAADLGLEVMPFQNITLLRQRSPRGSPAEQIDTLLNWAMPIEPGVVAVRSMLNPQFGAAALGDNVVPAMGDVQLPAGKGDVLPVGQPGRWTLWPGVSQGSNAHSLVLKADNSQPVVNATLSTGKLVAGQNYVLLFHYRNIDLKGEQRVFLSAYTEAWKPIDTFPYAVGFLCTPNSDSSSAFAFHVPANAAKAVLRLTITGTGTAEFDSIQIRLIK